MFGGAVDGGKVFGKYPTDFQQGYAAKLALSRGRMIPTTPWDAVSCFINIFVLAYDVLIISNLEHFHTIHLLLQMWKGTVEWFGIDPNSPPNEDGKTEMDNGYCTANAQEL